MCGDKNARAAKLMILAPADSPKGTDACEFHKLVEFHEGAFVGFLEGVHLPFFYHCGAHKLLIPGFEHWQDILRTLLPKGNPLECLTAKLTGIVNIGPTMCRKLLQAMQELAPKEDEVTTVLVNENNRCSFPALTCIEWMNTYHLLMHTFYTAATQGCLVTIEYI